MRRLIFSPSALQDIRDILLWSRKEFGLDVSVRYRELLLQAFVDLGEDAFRVGTRMRTEIAEGVMTYHLAHSRSRVAGTQVKSPCHFILYRLRGIDLEVGRILHDARDLKRHVSGSFEE